MGTEKGGKRKVRKGEGEILRGRIGRIRKKERQKQEKSKKKTNNY
jgi:hypothetical protein